MPPGLTARFLQTVFCPRQGQTIADLKKEFGAVLDDSLRTGKEKTPRKHFHHQRWIPAPIKKTGIGKKKLLPNGYQIWFSTKKGLAA